MRTSKKQVLEIVDQHLEAIHPGGATLSVLRSGIRHEESWWYVPVKPDRQLPSRFEYYESLARAEVDIQRDHNITILFVPVMADEAVAA